MRVRAYAKINRSLRVLGARPDGYHELLTVFQSIALHDTLIVEAIDGPLAFSSDDPACPADRTNLVWRAAEAMWQAAGRHGAARDVSIRLAKRIPMQAGLGGGSSDAAAAIRVLGRLWRVHEVEQRRIGAELGADIPYFFEGGTALGTGRGDRIVPLPDEPRAFVVLVLPSFGVSTKEAFSWWDADRGSAFARAPLDGELRRTRRSASREGGPRTRHRGPGTGNDLEPPVARRHPEIGRIVRGLKKLGAANAAMTGSGSTVFGLFSSQNKALDAAAALFSRARRTLVTRTIDRRACRRELAAK